MITPSGQYIQQKPHLLHFSWSIIGLKVLQSPVIPIAPSIGKDIGIVVSTDPVAIDKASYDLTFKKHEEDIFQKANNVDGNPIFDYSDKINLGSTDYDLITL